MSTGERNRNKIPSCLKKGFEIAAYYRRSNNNDSNIKPHSEGHKEVAVDKTPMTPLQISMYEMWGSPTLIPTYPIFAQDPTSGERKMIKKPSTRPHLYNRPHQTSKAEKKNMSPDESRQNLCRVIRQKKKQYGK